MLSRTTTIAQPARKIRGTPSARSTRPSLGSLVISSIRPSSRAVSRRPECGRTDSTSTPGTDSAAVIRTSGGRPGGSSTARSSMAWPSARSTTSTPRMSAPALPRAVATAPRLPGLSGRTTRSRNDTRHTLSMRSARPPGLRQPHGHGRARRHGCCGGVTDSVRRRRPEGNRRVTLTAPWDPHRRRRTLAGVGSARAPDHSAPVPGTRRLRSKRLVRIPGAKSERWRRVTPEPSGTASRVVGARA